MKYLFKIYLLPVSLFLLLLLGACSNNSVEQESSKDSESTTEMSSVNLIDKNNLIEGKWIDVKGDTYDNSDMFMTQKIDYVDSNNYELSNPAYITYFNNDEFVETVRYSFDEMPVNIKSVTDANNIIISFFSKETDDITLKTK